MRADAEAYVDPTPTPMRANWRLRAERDVCETGRPTGRAALRCPTTAAPTRRAGSEGRAAVSRFTTRASDHGVDRRDERGWELRHGRDGIVIAVDGEHDDVGDRVGEQALAA